METSMYYWHTLDEHLSLSMRPLPFLSSQRFWELSITHIQIQLQNMCFPRCVVGIGILWMKKVNLNNLKGSMVGAHLSA